MLENKASKDLSSFSEVTKPAWHLELEVYGTALLALAWYNWVCGLSHQYNCSALSSWSHLLLFTIVFWTFDTFSASFRVNAFLRVCHPVRTSQNCFIHYLHTRDYSKYTVSYSTLHVPDLWCGQRSLSTWSTTTNVGLATIMLIQLQCAHRYAKLDT